MASHFCTLLLLTLNAQAFEAPNKIHSNIKMAIMLHNNIKKKKGFGLHSRVLSKNNL